MKIGILTSGGDCPGINATIRGVCKTAINHYGMEVYGIHSGFRGLLDNDVEPLTEKSLSGLLNLGGTILGTSREKPFKKRLSAASEDKPALMLKNIHDLGLDCIVCIGGNGTQKTAAKLAQAGVNVVSVPKTIDNDVACTEITFGYNTAVSVAAEAIDRLHTTGETHHRIMVLEVMGRYAGWIALESAIAGGADVALIPEIPYDINSAARKILNRKNRGKAFSIVVVAEGAKPINGDITIMGTRNNGKGVDNTKLGGAGFKVAKELEELTGLEARCTVLGYMQRGGSPTAFDRVLSTKYGAKAMELAMEGKFNVLTVIKDGRLNYVPLEDVVGNNKKIGAASGNTAESNIRKVNLDHDLVKTARHIGINLGD